MGATRLAESSSLIFGLRQSLFQLICTFGCPSGPIGPRGLAWNQDLEDSFVATKFALKHANTLPMPASRNTFILETDVSGHGIAAVLLQLRRTKRSAWLICPKR